MNKEEIESAEWLVENRSNVQKFHLRLYVFSEKYAEKLKSDKDKRLIFHLLIGVSFGLWRSVFLMRSNIDYDKEVTVKGLKFLERLIKDNAIAYTQEKDSCEWTVGYYLNDAFLRLQLIQNKFIKKDNEIIEKYFQTLISERSSQNVSQESWENALEISNNILDLIEQ